MRPPANLQLLPDARRHHVEAAPAAACRCCGSSVLGGSAPMRSNRLSSLGGGRAERGSSRPFAANQSGFSSARSPSLL